MPLTAEAKKRMLEALLPAEPVYLGLLLQPESSKEIVDPDYARVAVSEWSTLPDGSARLNAVTIAWPAVQGAAIARAVGFFDAPAGGKLLLVLPTLTLLGGAETEIVLAPGDVAQLPVGSVRIEIG